MTVEYAPHSTSVGLGAVIHPTARVGIATVIGANCWIGPHVRIGDRCIIQPGAVIGADGFGYVRESDGTWSAKGHDFGVRIGDDVHIGANTCVDRGSWRDTIIERGARIDNLVHVAHNVLIDPDAVIVACAELSGSVTVGEGAWVGPKACVKQRLTIGAKALVGMGAVVLEDVPENVTVAGNPAKVINAEVGVRDRM